MTFSWMLQMSRKQLNPQTFSKKRKQWSEIDMANAIQAVRTNVMGLHKASKMFNVPRPTLQRLSRNSASPSEAAATKLGRKPIINETLEKELVEYLVIMESKFHGLTRQDVRRISYELCERNRIKHPFTGGLAGRAWLDHFISRHTDMLPLLKPTAATLSKANGFNREDVGRFFDILDFELKKHKYPADRVFNVDETGISIVQSKNLRVVGLKGKRQIGALNTAEKKSLVTVVSCMSAGGTFIPPLFIFPRKNMTDELMKGAPPGSIGRCHPSGWIQSNLFIDWLKHFIKKAEPTREDPVLLILDGYNSYTKNIDIVDLARHNHVALLSLPPHTSHKLQPLSQTFMDVLKLHYSEAIRQWMRHSERPVGPYDICELFGKAYLMCQTVKIAVKGFQVTGIFPFNRNVFTDTDFAPADEDQPHFETLRKRKDEKSNFTVLIGPNSTHVEAPPSERHPDTICKDYSYMTTNRAQRGLYNMNNEQSFQIQTFQPSETGLEESGPSGACGYNSTRHKQKEAIGPSKDNWTEFKLKEKITNKGSKTCTVALMASSPYTNIVHTRKKERGDLKRQVNGLKNKLRLSDKQKLNVPIKQSFMTKHKLDLEFTDSEPDDIDSYDSGESLMELEIGVTKPGDDDAVCLFCESLFSEDKPGELWVQCLVCQMWAHNECAGSERDSYVCDFCK